MSARSSVNRIPSLRACRSQALLNSSPQRTVNRPSTLNLTPLRDDSTAVIFIPYPAPSAEMSRRETRLAVARALDAELTHPVAKGIGMEIEDFRGTLRPIDHSILLMKDCLDMASLHFFQRGQLNRRFSDTIFVRNAQKQPCATLEGRKAQPPGEDFRNPKWRNASSNRGAQFARGLKTSISV
jgi:hypothetical protein